MKRSRLKRYTRLQRSKPIEARATPRRKPRHSGKRPTVAEVNAREQFKTVACSEPCIGRRIPGHVCDGPLQAMHVVSKHTLKRRGLRRHLWDVANGVAGCERIHRRHDLAVERIPRELLPARCIEWAERLGVLDSLERHWPTTSTEAKAA